MKNIRRIKGSEDIAGGGGHTNILNGSQGLGPPLRALVGAPQWGLPGRGCPGPQGCRVQPCRRLSQRGAPEPPSFTRNDDESFFRATGLLKRLEPRSRHLTVTFDPARPRSPVAGSSVCGQTRPENRGGIGGSREHQPEPKRS